MIPDDESTERCSGCGNPRGAFHRLGCPRRIAKDGAYENVVTAADSPPPPDAAEGEERVVLYRTLTRPPYSPWQNTDGRMAPDEARRRGYEVREFVPLACATAAEDRADASETRERVTHERAEQAESQLAHYKAEVERLAHGICDALDPGKPTEPILRALIRGTEHEGHRPPAEEDERG